MDDWHYTHWFEDYLDLLNREEPFTETTLYSSRKCDRIINAHQVDDPSDDEPYPGYGQPVYHAELFDLISEAPGIPVENEWCLKPKTSIENDHANPAEGCHSCSANYSEEMNWLEANELCGDESSGNENPTDTTDKADDGKAGCAVMGAGSLATLMVFAPIPALRRSRQM